MSEWISVRQELPAIRDGKDRSWSVLATDGKAVFIRQFFVGISGWGVRPVTHWQFLPAPPETPKDPQ